MGWKNVCSSRLGTFLEGPEPEFLNILKCNSAESEGTGFQLKFLLFLMIKLLQELQDFDHFSGVLKLKKIYILYHLTKTEAYTNPVVLSDL